jgi:vacuolar-type H+-ATPase subunit E/Vma4
MNLKADQDLLEKFKNNVESNVLSNLNSKLDKIDHKRVQNSFRKKLDSLEDRLVGKKSITSNVNTDSFISNGKAPLMTKGNGSVCASCNRDSGGLD